MKAIFFIRHHNDYDSLAPVADGWARAAPDNEAIIYVSTPALKWKKDVRTALLRDTPRVTFVDLWQIAGAGEYSMLERAWQNNLPDDRLQRRVLELTTEMRIAPGYDRKLSRWLERQAPDIVAFDWWDVPKRRKPFDHFGYQTTIDWTQAHSVPLVSLPHGLFVYWPKTACAIRWKMPCDAIFVENEIRRRMFIEGGHAPEQIAACGAPRYDVDWIERIASALARGHEKTQPKRRDGEVRIVFFGKRAAYYYDFDEQLEWLRHLADHPAVRLTIQPHPRGQKLKSLRALAGHPHIEIDARTPASLLIRGADMVSTLTSSVMVEGVMTGREILYPRYLTSVETPFDNKGACVAIDRIEDTHAAIDRYLAGERIPKRAYEEFLKEIVFAGKGPHPIARIVERMSSLARHKRCERPMHSAKSSVGAN